MELMHVLVRVTTTVMKRHDQRQLGEKRVYFAHTTRSHPITEGSQDRKLRLGRNLGGQELMHRPWRSPAYRFAPHVLFNLLSY